MIRHALFRDTTFSLGAIVAKRLNLNHTNGPVLGGIFASHLAAHFNIPIRHYEKEEKLLPLVFLDYKSMVAHDFIVKNKKKMLNYRLMCHKKHVETITLPAPSLFDIFSGMCLILPEAIQAYESLTSAPELEPLSDPHRQSIYQWDPEEIANQWHPEDPSQYDPSYNFDPWA